MYTIANFTYQVELCRSAVCSWLIGEPFAADWHRFPSVSLDSAVAVTRSKVLNHLNSVLVRWMMSIDFQGRQVVLFV